MVLLQELDKDKHRMHHNYVTFGNGISDNSVFDDKQIDILLLLVVVVVEVVVVVVVLTVVVVVVANEHKLHSRCIKCHRVGRLAI